MKIEDVPANAGVPRYFDCRSRIRSAYEFATIL